MKNHENSFKLRVEKTASKKSYKNKVWDHPRLHFGRFWEAPGRHWNAPGHLVGVSSTLLTLLGRLFGPMGASDLILKGVWGALGKVSGGFWEDFGRI